MACATKDFFNFVVVQHRLDRLHELRKEKGGDTRTRPAAEGLLLSPARTTSSHPTAPILFRRRHPSKGAPLNSGRAEARAFRHSANSTTEGYNARRSAVQLHTLAKTLAGSQRSRPSGHEPPTFQGPPERTQHRCTRDVRDVLPGPGTAGHGCSTQEGEGTWGRPFHNLWNRKLAPAEPRAGSPSLLLDRGGPVAGVQLEQLLHS